MNFLEGTKKEFTPFQNVHVKPGKKKITYVPCVLKETIDPFP